LGQDDRTSILLLYPSCFHYPAWMERVELKTSQLLLASYLAQFFRVEYADLEITVGRPNTPLQISRFERHVRQFLAARDFDVLAISCWTSLSYQSTLAIARICRELHPGRVIVVGGYHPSARPLEFNTPERLFDYVVCGEGELALQEIGTAVRTRGRPPETQILRAPTFPQSEFVRQDWSLAEAFVAENFPEGLQNIYIFLSRGCPFSCSFCMEPLKDQRWRAFPPELAVDEIWEVHRRFKANSIAICDACFGMRAVWRKEFLRLLVETQPPFWVTLETRPEYLDEDDIKLFAQMKVEIQLGIESCAPEMLSIMQKSKQPERFLERFQSVSHLMSEHGVLHRANLIFNHPGESRRTLEATFAFIDRELENRDSSLMWACHGYMHFPGCDCDARREYYEQKFGSRFIAPHWWIEQGDQYENSQRFIPSADLDNGRTGLWREMLDGRSDRMKSSLSQRAFRFAANKYFGDWKNDARYAKS
jgi:radical SAM superfamily enzyme YgiQ (UPF0313 family)